VGREQFSDLRAGHVTLRVIDGIPSLRCKAFVEEIRASFGKACDRDDFRLIHYSVQHDHLHLIVEAEDSDALGRGMKSLSARVARAVHRIFERTGRVLDGRYHLHLLGTVTEVWNALRYVLLNARKHFRQRFGKTPPAGIDQASSGRWFEGWLGGVPGIRDGPSQVERQVARPRSWLLREGWKRRGPIDAAAVPGF
jgi:REP element-mobilizing transposase RayT